MYWGTYRLKKCCIILVILNFLFSNFVYSAIEPFCNENLNQNEISSIYSLKPSKINIKISDYRLWSINNLEILCVECHTKRPNHGHYISIAKHRVQQCIQLKELQNIKQ